MAATVKAAAVQGEKKSLFSQRAVYTGPTAKLTVNLRETDDGSYRVFAVVEKKGQKKDKGMMTAVKDRAAALKRFEEISAQCLSAGWKLKVGGASSAFDTIPAAE